MWEEKGKRDTLGAIGNNACQKSKVKCLRKKTKEKNCANACSLQSAI